MSLEIGNPSVGVDGGRAGVYAPSTVLTNQPTTLTPAAGGVYAARFATSRALAVTKIAFVTQTAAGANDGVEVGIYNRGGTGLLATSGVVTGVLNATAGVQTVALAYSLPAGVYYAALLVATIGGTAPVVRAVNFATNPSVGMFGAAVGTWEGIVLAGQASLPASIAAAAVSSTPPIFAVREV